MRWRLYFVTYWRTVQVVFKGYMLRPVPITVIWPILLNPFNPGSYYKARPAFYPALQVGSPALLVCHTKS